MIEGLLKAVEAKLDSMGGQAITNVWSACAKLGEGGGVEGLLQKLPAATVRHCAAFKAKNCCAVLNAMEQLDVRDEPLLQVLSCVHFVRYAPTYAHELLCSFCRA